MLDSLQADDDSPAGKFDRCLREAERESEPLRTHLDPRRSDRAILALISGIR